MSDQAYASTSSLVPVTEPGKIPDSESRFRFAQASPLTAFVQQTNNTHHRAWEQASLDVSNNAWAWHPSSTSLQPTSPLLHSRFRVSTLTELSSGDDSSFLDTSAMSPIDGPEVRYSYHDGESVYSNMTESPLDQTWPTLPLDPTPLSETFSRIADGKASTDNSSTALVDGSAVALSSPDSQHQVFSSFQGKAPVVASTMTNFSRPVRRPLDGTEEQKRKVLERNLVRPQTSNSEGESSLAGVQAPAGAASPQSAPPSSGLRAPDPFFRVRVPSSSSTHLPLSTSSAFSTATLPELDRSNNTPSPLPQIVVSLASDMNTEVRSQGNALDGRAVPVPNPPRPVSPESKKTPQDYLLLGIDHHEGNRLKESAKCFEKSAKEQGGCGMGMLMWGLTLRHGWGCEKNEKQGFKWLQKAAQNAVDDLQRAGSGTESPAVRNELVLAIYEVGQCFYHGWGVRKDREMAVKYYTVAAQLGDADAQQDLAFCLANGKGCKKDKRAAAKWHRAAVAQGGSDIGLAWIYKEKYQ